MNRLRLLPWVLGVALVVGSLVGANRLLHPDQPSPGGAGGGNDPPRPKPSPKDGGPVVVTGVVATEEEMVAYGASPLLPSARVADVYVKEGQEVAAGDPLYKFDDANSRAELARAKAAVETYRRKKESAERYQQVMGPILVKKAQTGVDAAKRQRDLARQAHDSAAELARKYAEQVNRGAEPGKQSSKEEIERQVQNHPDVLKAQAALDQAEAKVKETELDLEQAKNAPYEDQVREAAAAVAQAETAVAQAELVVKECVVTARVAGVVERLEAGPGVPVGPATRTPLLWLIPKGQRIVRAEVVPEFAFKIQNRVGQKVTILDDNNTALTYDGEIKRVSGSFLPKRSAGADFLSAKPQLVLELIVTLTDPEPPGKPPLRVGQPVRVSIGQ